MRKKILFMIHDLGQGGAEKVLVNLVNNLNQEEFDITVMSLFGGGVNEQFLKRGIRYKVVFDKTFPRNSHLMKLFTPEQLHKFFIKEKYDIEISYLEGPCARIISGGKDKETKRVCWIHGEQHTKEYASASFRNYDESVVCYGRFDKIVVVSEDVKKDFLGLYANIKEAIVLYNTNETKKIIEMKDEDVDEDIFFENEIRLCGVGRILPNKGFDKLAKVHKRLRDEGYQVHTYVLGKGPEQNKIEKYLNENHLANSFTFLGYQVNPYKYVSKCDLFICTSVAEGFSTAATEALIVGTPVVTTPVAGMKELLEVENKCGVVAGKSEESIYENVKKLLDYPQLLSEFKKNASMRGKDFCTETTVRAVEMMLQNL